MAQEVFISYSHFDAEMAEAIAERLERGGISCWYAPRNIEPGDDWASAIIRGINACRVLVLVFSEPSNKSVQVLREVNNAISAGKAVIPFKISDTVPTGAMQYYLSTLHWLDASADDDPRESLDELYERVQQVLTGEREKFEAELLAQTTNTRRDSRKKKKKGGFFSFLYGIPAIIINAIFGFIMIGSYIGLCGFKNSTAAGLMGLFVMSLTFLFFQITKLIGKPITKHHWLICAGALLLVVAGILFATKYLDRGFPTSNIPDNGQEVSMNVTNHSYSIRSEDGMVYFCHNERGESPGIRKCTYEQFLAGDKGEEIVSGVWTDYLALVGSRYLVFRDYTNNKRLMKLYDLETGEIKILKKRSCYCFYGSDDAVFYAADTSASNSVGVVTLDGRYDGDYFDQDCSSGWVCYYNRDVYYVDPNGFLTNYRFGTLQFERMNRFLIYDDVVYYCAGKGGLYRAPLSDPDDSVKLTGYSVLSISVCGDYLYFINENDSDSLYRVPLDGGENELVLDGTFSEINVIGDCLYLSDSAENYTRLNVNDIPAAEQPAEEAA